ncbi:MAG: PilZ domain-containing protein [Deltaproteobacteria bacterium]|nr:PilZ domain-containing protein [Deltaproteobacteria bacterium]
MGGPTRDTPRVFCGRPGCIEGPAGAIHGRVLNLSRGGSFFLADQLLPIGHTCEVSIDLPGLQPIRALGEVRYHYRCSDGEGMGICFMRLSGEAMHFISQFVDARVGNA